MRFGTRRGQSLVEMAIALPVLVIMLLGVFEVGRALRTYMIVANASREAARFAAKPTNTDFRGTTWSDIGYLKTVSHTVISVGDSLWDFREEGSVVLSLYDLPDMYPCDPATREITAEDKWANCNCETAVLDPYQAPMVKHPGLYPYMTYSWPYSLTSGIDPYEESDKLMREHLWSNCVLGKTSINAVPQVEQVVVAEVGYNFKQIGFPLFTIIVPERIPMTVTTVMRYTSDRTYQ